LFLALRTFNTNRGSARMNFWNVAFFVLIVIIVVGWANQASPIVGVWKHSEKPAWIDIRFDGEVGSARIARHDDNEEAVGLGLLSHIEADEANPNVWRAEIYSAEDDGYVAAVLVLGRDGELVISTAEQGNRATEVLRLKRDSER